MMFLCRNWRAHFFTQIAACLHTIIVRAQSSIAWVNCEGSTRFCGEGSTVSSLGDGALSFFVLLSDLRLRDLSAKAMCSPKIYFLRSNSGKTILPFSFFPRFSLLPCSLDRNVKWLIVISVQSAHNRSGGRKYGRASLMAVEWHETTHF